MNQVEADLRSYYESEANLGLRTGLRGRRVEFRNEFIEVMQSENLHSVVDFGAGPGHDGAGFEDAGCSYLGLDLAHGNAVLGASAGIAVVQGSIKAPPFVPEAFEAGWSMSTIMHLPDAEVPKALSAMVRTLQPGAPFGVGLWGADTTREPADEIDTTNIEGRRRLFSLRTFERNRELFGAAATIEREAVWPIDVEGWEYHAFVLRA